MIVNGSTKIVYVRSSETSRSLLGRVELIRLSLELELDDDGETDGAAIDGL